MAPKIRVEELVKVFVDARGNQLKAIDGLNLSVEEGEFVCLLGPSGCGKSTCLNVLAGLLPPTKGKILIDGIDVASSPAKAKFGFVFQDPRLLPWKTVWKNIQFSLEAGRRIPSNEYAERVRSVLDLVGLKGFDHSYPHELSGGMQTRAAIARSLVVDPEVILMDEPFSNLDEITARKMRAELLSLWQKKRKTIIFVTHDVNEAVYLADRVLVLTPRPSHVYVEKKIEIPRPRDYTDESLFTCQKDIVAKFEEMLSQYQ